MSLEAVGDRIRRASTGLRRGSRVRRDAEWHSASCKAPRSSYTHFVQESESLRQQVHQPIYAIQQSSRTSEVLEHPAIPRIKVTHPPRESRRTSICSPLRFTRTVSTDSIDSLERQCLRDLRWQRMMEAEMQQQGKSLQRQVSVRNGEKSLQNTEPVASTSLEEPVSSFPHLARVGRSKTDPGNEDQQGPSANNNGNPRNGLQRSPLSLSNGESTLKKSDTLKRSSPDLLLDGVARSRILSEVIGLSCYQQKLISQCWPNIYSTGINGSFASQLYATLYAKNAKAKALMQKADGVAVFTQSDADCTTMHTKLTLELIDRIVRNLDAHPGAIIAYLNEIGQVHRSLRTEGISIAMWDDLGDAILDGVRKNEVVRKHKELRRAWLAVIAFITDNIKQGQSLFRSSPSTEGADLRFS
ncbi:unnamed protein product [Bursaphelenchus xylophilus]|uniref:(pine wood nematode) hypothetical protein n=1 Tax=Bursaphelenchus xylophilus TaxID=6326 RepID=A0A1I7RNF4_BURXY|nr:unnamed protein product [Bursaphelenchus xylophilus]CAG9123957.1 unnamed protein product [Bursaphelenchus xylophilus]